MKAFSIFTLGLIAPLLISHPIRAAAAESVAACVAEELEVKVPKDEESLIEAIFRKCWYGHYESGLCPLNVRRFLTKLERENGSLDDFRVLVIRKADGTRIEPHFPRNQRTTTWTFHVLAERKGLIYDFDYGSSPTGVPASTYFQAQFGNQMDQLIVGVAPGSEFRSFLMTSDFFRELKTSTIPLKEFIKR